MKMHSSQRSEQLRSHDHSEDRVEQLAKRVMSLEFAKLWNWILAVALLTLAAPFSLIADDVLQHHLNGARNGLYVDPLITQRTATTTHRDKTFNAPLPGPVYAQPLYVRNGPGGKPAFIVATEQNVVLALDASSGSEIWRKRVGNPVSRSRLPCGD